MAEEDTVMESRAGFGFPSADSPAPRGTGAPRRRVRSYNLRNAGQAPLQIH